MITAHDNFMVSTETSKRKILGLEGTLCDAELEMQSDKGEIRSGNNTSDREDKSNTETDVKPSRSISCSWRIVHWFHSDE